MFKPQETTLELNRQRYQEESSEDRQQNNMSTNENQIAGGSSKILEAKHMVNPKYGKKKRVSIMLKDEILQDEKSENYYSVHFIKQDTRDAIDMISNTDSISIASHSYEMIENGLNPYEIEALKMSRRKSCLCKHSDLIFSEKEDSEYTNNFPEEFMGRLGHFVTAQLNLNSSWSDYIMGWPPPHPTTPPPHETPCCCCAADQDFQTT